MTLRYTALLVLVACITLPTGCASLDDSTVFGGSDPRRIDMAKTDAIETIRSYFPRTDVTREYLNDSPVTTKIQTLVALDENHIVIHVNVTRPVATGPFQPSYRDYSAGRNALVYSAPAKLEDYSFELNVPFADVYEVHLESKWAWAEFRTSDRQGNLQFDQNSGRGTIRMANALLALCPNANKHGSWYNALLYPHSLGASN
jgi:hypothetical protein